MHVVHAGKSEVSILSCLPMLAPGTVLPALITSETQRGPDFLRLANALSALYPKDSTEKRLLDAMLLAVPR